MDDSTYRRYGGLRGMDVRTFSGEGRGKIAGCLQPNNPPTSINPAFDPVRGRCSVLSDSACVLRSAIDSCLPRDHRLPPPVAPKESAIAAVPMEGDGATIVLACEEALSSSPPGSENVTVLDSRTDSGGTGIESAQERERLVRRLV
jgi:hypothetical protein